MTEETTYGRLEKKIDQMQSQMSVMKEALIRLSAQNEAYQLTATHNAQNLDAMQTEVNQAKGGLNFVKLISGTALGAILGFGTWTVQSLSATQLRIADTNQRIAIAESKLIRLDTDIAVLSKRPPMEPIHEQ